MKKNNWKSRFSLLKKFFQKNYYFLFVLIIFFLSFILFQKTFHKDSDQLVIAGKIWSDFAAHIPMVRSFSLGGNFNLNNWPPQYPVFAGEKINYHYGFYLLVAGLEALGLNLTLAMNLLSAVGVTFLLVMILKISDKLFKSKNVGWLAVVLFLFNGSLSFVEYFSDKGFSWESLKGIFSQINFASFGPWDGGQVSAFWNWNIYTNQRHLALGFGLMLVVVFSLHRPTNKKNLIENFSTLVLIALLPIFHQAAYLAVGIIVIVHWLLDFKNKWGLKKYLWQVMGLVLGLATYSTISSGYLPQWNWGFLATEKTFFGVLNYWWFNLGLYLPLLPIVLIKSSKKYRPLLLSGLLMFILANSIQFSPDMINNHKLINIFQIILVMGVAELLIKTWQIKKSWLQKLSVVVVFLGLIFSGVIDLFPVLNDGDYILDDYQASEFGRWAENETNSSSVFLTNTYLYNPVSLAGRKTFLDYGYFAWSMGYPDKERRKVLPKVFAKEISREEWCVISNLELVDYLLINQQDNDLDELKNLVEKEIPAFYNFSTPVFSSSKYLVYSRKAICQ